MSARSGNSVESDPADRDDELLVRALRDGDEPVFNQLVECWSGMMLRLALTHVGSRAIAEEVVVAKFLEGLRLARPDRAELDGRQLLEDAPDHTGRPAAPYQPRRVSTGQRAWRMT